jgi:chromosome segregation ATPase
MKSKQRRKKNVFNLVIGILVLCTLALTVWFVATGYLTDNSDEESIEQLRERLKQTFKERNELRKQVSELDTLRKKVQSQSTINKSQLKELKSLRQEVKLYSKLKAQGVHNTITKLESDLRAYESLNSQYKEMLQECLDEKKEAKHLEMEAELAVEEEDEALQKTRGELENTRQSLLEDERVIAALKQKLKNLIDGNKNLQDEEQKDKIIELLKEELALMHGALADDEEEISETLTKLIDAEMELKDLKKNNRE